MVSLLCTTTVDLKVPTLVVMVFDQRSSLVVTLNCLDGRLPVKKLATLCDLQNLVDVRRINNLTTAYTNSFSILLSSNSHGIFQGWVNRKHFGSQPIHQTLHSMKAKIAIGYFLKFDMAKKFSHHFIRHSFVELGHH